MKAKQKYIQRLFKSYMFPPDKIPLLISNTILAGYFFGEDGLAVVTLFMPIYFLFETAGYWINYGGLIKTLEEISNNQPLARSYSSLSLMLSTIAGIILAALVLIFFENLLEILAVPEGLKILAQDYGKFLVVAGFLLLISFYVWQFVKVIGLQIRIKKIYVLIMVVDVLGCVLCEKFFGLGIISLVVGMVAAEIFIITFGGILLRKSFKENLFGKIQEPISSAWSLICAGSSVSAGKFYTLFQVYIFNLFLLKFYGTTGVAIFAVLQVAIRICRLHSQVTWQPLPPLLTAELGDKNISAMFLIFKTAMKLAIIFAALPAVVIFFGADFLIIQSSLNPAEYNFAADALKTYSLSVVLAAVNSVFIAVYLSGEHKIFSNVTEFARSIVAVILFLKFAAPENIFWSFLFAEGVAAVILVAGIFLLQKTKNYRTLLLLNEKIFCPSCYEIFDYAEKNWSTDKLAAFLEQQKISSRRALTELENWRQRFEEITPNAKNHFLAVHLYTEENLLHMTLRDNGNRIERTQQNIKFTLGFNNIYYREDLTKGGDY